MQSLLLCLSSSWPLNLLCVLAWLLPKHSGVVHTNLPHFDLASKSVQKRLQPGLRIMALRSDHAAKPLQKGSGVTSVCPG